MGIRELPWSGLLTCRHGRSLREICDDCVAQALRPPIKTRRQRRPRPMIRMSDLRGAGCLADDEEEPDECGLFG